MKLPVLTFNIFYILTPDSPRRDSRNVRYFLMF